MPVTPFNYAGIAPQGYEALGTLADSLRQGMEAGATPRRTALQNQNMELVNALQSIRAKFEPEKAELANELMRAQIEKTRTPQEFAPDTFLRALKGEEQVASTFGPNSKQSKLYESYLDNLAAGQQGTSIAFDPVSGQPIINIGGSAKGGAGLQQAGNELISPLTQQQKTRAQRQLAGEKAFSRYADEMKKLGKYQTASGKSKVILGRLGNFLGGDFGAPTEVAQAETAVELGAESLLSAYGLPSTEKTIRRLAEVLHPRTGESGDGYQKRINNIERLVKEGGKEALQSLMTGVRAPIESLKGETETEFELKVTDPKVMQTAKNRGISPEEVIKIIQRNRRG